MTTKTIRFYENREADKQALKILSNYQAYGCNSENSLVLKALRALEERTEDTLAEQIAAKVVEKLGDRVVPKEDPPQATDDTFLKACAFMDGL